MHIAAVKEIHERLLPGLDNLQVKYSLVCSRS